MTVKFSPVIGLEIHVQLSTATKMFCSCSADSFGAPPNSHICPGCLGLPGSLPTLNKGAVELGVKAAMALSCRVRNRSVFHRKHYFYADLPKAYQISQHDLPLAEDGHIFITGAEGSRKKIRINRLHLEEDAGKLVHSAADGRLKGAEYSMVDYNRGGMALAEIVSEPDLASPAEAREYASRIRQIVRYVEVSDGDMEKGSLRVDANISVKMIDEETGGLVAWSSRSEVKNLNSLRSLERALEYEVQRHKEALSGGDTLTRETRHWNDGEGVTSSMRSKEEALDYRLFPDPDIPPLVVSEELLGAAKAALPEAPWIKEERYREELGLSEGDGILMAESLPVATYFERSVAAGASPVRAANWIRTEVFRVMNEHSLSIEDFPVGPIALGGLVGLIDQGKLSNTVAKEVFASMAKGSSMDEAIAEAGASPGGLTPEDVDEAVDRVIGANSDAAEFVRSGKDQKGKKVKFLTGLVMKETRGQADPSFVLKKVEERLKIDR